MVITSWGLLGYLALADAVLSEDTASDNDFGLVYTLLVGVTFAAPTLGVAALLTARARGEHWFARSAFVLSLVLPCIWVIEYVYLRNGTFVD